MRSRQRIVLYNPDAVFWALPLALIAIASALDPERFEVVIVDGRLDSHARLLEALDGAVCLGVTTLTGAPLGDALSATRAARARYPELPIVWGGWHASLFPEMCAREPSVSAAVIGQGEDTFAELVERVLSGSSLAGVAGTVVADAASLDAASLDAASLEGGDWSPGPPGP